MKAYDVIHEVVKGITDQAPPVRRETEVQIITTDGYTFEINHFQYDEDRNILWVKAEVTE